MNRVGKLNKLFFSLLFTYRGSTPTPVADMQKKVFFTTSLQAKDRPYLSNLGYFVSISFSRVVIKNCGPVIPTPSVVIPKEYRI